MPSKYSILDNIDQYSAEELHQHILQGTVTFEELLNEGLPPKVRNELRSLVENGEGIAWDKARSANTPDAYDAFLKQYPGSAHAAEVNGLLEEAEWNAASRANSPEPIMEFLRKFPASVHAAEARRLIDNIDDLKWNAVDKNDRSALEMFIAQNPGNPNAAKARKALDEILQAGAWNEVDKNSIDSLQRFIDTYPTDPHRFEAQKRINALIVDNLNTADITALVAEINRIQTDKSVIDPEGAIFETVKNYLLLGRITTKEIVDAIADDHNLLRASVLNRLIEEGFLGYNHLTGINIDPRFIHQLAKKVDQQEFAPPTKLNQIDKLSTEIYFWGIPSSGKSCALGAILSVAANGRVARTMIKDNDCQGYGYMTRLASLFNSSGGVGLLPPGTSIYSTYEMGFNLLDQENKVHPITCIDLAGELVRCMYKSDAGEELNEDEYEALDTLTNILSGNRSKNRKVHFFVIEYGAENRLYQGLPQIDYLDGALRYIERTNIFEKDTDAIYLMISKVDKLKSSSGNLREDLKHYVSSSGYLGFYNGLTAICEHHEINDGRVEIIPFSLGQVCFQDFCLFNEHPATNVVNTLLARTKGIKTGKFHNFLKKFTK